MDNNIIKIDEEGLKNDLKGVFRKTIEETPNTMLDEEAAELCHAEKHERTEGRQNYRSGHYQRKLLTTAGEVELSVPKLRLAPFERAIIERYRRRESSVEESLIEMYLAGVSVLVAIGVAEDGYRKILGACEGASESKECRRSFLVSLRERGLNGVRLFR